MTTMLQPAPRVAIIGGGIAGLSAAFYLQRAARAAGQPIAITIIERAGRLGGKVQTETVALAGAAEPFVIEGGPDSFITQKPAGLQLVRDLGLDDQLLNTSPARHKVYVLHKGRPHPLPDGVLLVVPTALLPFVRSPLISWRGKLRMALDLVIPARRDGADETLAGFIRRRLGREALDKIAEPLMAGIYNAESERLSLLASFPRFRAVEEQHASLIRGMRAARGKSPAGSQPTSPFISLRGGIGGLIEALAAQIEAEVLLGTSVTALEHQPGAAQPYQLALDSGASLAADAVVLAAPAYVAADLLAATAPELAAGLRQIRYVSTATVSLAYRRSEIGMPLDSYGLVIPQSEGRRINACTISSRKFAGRAPADHVLLRAFVGGSRHPEALYLADPELLDLVRDELRQIFGISAAPVLSRVYRWPLANPQYDVGHLERVAELERRCPPGLLLCGSAYRGVGLPDCIQQGQAAARQTLEWLAHLPRSEAVEYNAPR